MGFWHSLLLAWGGSLQGTARRKGFFLKKKIAIIFVAVVKILALQKNGVVQGFNITPWTRDLAKTHS
jgi:hypothetical protein